MNKITETSIGLQELLKNQLNRFPRVNNEVEGFSENNVSGFTSRNPIDIKNLLGPKFSRNFDLSLKMAMIEIKESNVLDKGQLHGALLEKYLGVAKNAFATLQVLPDPNAYHSLPAEANDDYNLHLSFLQPNRLFGIDNQNRKFSRIDPNTGNREWLWSKSGCDSAPFFRKIMQIYILSEILQDYETVDSPFRDAQIATALPQLEALRANLLKQIPTDLERLLSSVTEQMNAVRAEDNPEGILGSDASWIGLLDIILPGIEDIASFYPIGRLLYGQPRIEPHHEVASRGSTSKIGYLFAWLYSHLNFSTSLFWLQTALKICKDKWDVFRDYVTDRQVSFRSLALQGLFFIPNALILAFAPLLMLIPPIYGITSIPFSVVRSLFLHGPRSLKSFRILKLIDTLELIKDGFIFYLALLVLIEYLLVAAFATDYIMLLGTIPSIIIGFTNLLIVLAIPIIAIIVTLNIFRFQQTRIPHINPNFNIDIDSFEQALSIERRISITDTAPSQLKFVAFLVSSSIFLVTLLTCAPVAALFLNLVLGIRLAELGLACYLISGVAARYTIPYIPAAISNKFLQLISPVTSRIWLLFFRLRISEVRRLLNQIENKMRPEEIIPDAARRATIPLPKAPARIAIPPVMAEEAGRLFSQLGRVNQLPNLSEERKEIIKKWLNRLDTDKVNSLEGLREAMTKATELLELNFTAVEATTMERLTQHFATEFPDRQQEINAIRIQGNNGSYQPSWKMIEMLRGKGAIDDDRQWHAPAEIAGLTPEMLEKCHKIRALKAER